MDATGLARSLLAALPAHRALGLDVVRAAGGVGEVSLLIPPRFGTVIGSLCSTDLATLVNAAGLAAIISVCPAAASFESVLPLGEATSLRFHAPARGRLVATSELTREARRLLKAVHRGAEPRARFATSACVTSEAGTVVCEGAFTWTVRRVDTHGLAA